MGGTYEDSDHTNCTFTDNWLWSLDNPTATPVAGGGAIQIGDTVQGSIPAKSAGIRYTFSAQAGAVITIRMSRTDGDLDPVVILFGPDETELVRNDDAPKPTNRDARIENFTLPASGTYTILATRFQEEIGLSAGEFSLKLERGQ
jgi:hypothetical protein